MMVSRGQRPACPRPLSRPVLQYCTIQLYSAVHAPSALWTVWLQPLSGAPSVISDTAIRLLSQRYNLSSSPGVSKIFQTSTEKPRPRLCNSCLRQKQEKFSGDL